MMATGKAVKVALLQMVAAPRRPDVNLRKGEDDEFGDVRLAQFRAARSRTWPPWPWQITRSRRTMGDRWRAVRMVD